MLYCFFKYLCALFYMLQKAFNKFKSNVSYKNGFRLIGFAAFLSVRFWALFISVINKSNFFEPFKFALLETVIFRFVKNLTNAFGAFLLKFSKKAEKKKFAAIITVFEHKLKNPSLNSIVKSGLKCFF
ncbi:hypothetical protein GGTG_04809 [Gaeumannomyces tritici R3-111a-1]|uniref:Uncharacterized protein n=1 Tax=Gaeumannomyces tritici (strain R3-111a-1) TaxID=644352 RepID=J3NU54_GAET3|nr:hypothetical protein GGTG_04809 [Gaeumannomyces tritici R3-111a-1]EJT79725.1 hypothetical protein GGTG_04809 [Gaeumannomyces tritici R3-111a-1]